MGTGLKSRFAQIIYSDCICGRHREFQSLISYTQEKVFKAYEDLSIARCSNCYVLKTLAAANKVQPVKSNTEFYEGNKNIFTDYFTKLVSQIVKYRKSGKVLDVGCATGILLNIFVKQGFTVWGLEPNPAAWKLSRTRFPKRIFQLKLSEFLKHHRLRFDVIVYNHVLEHVVDVQKEIQNIKKALKPGGMLVLGLPNTDNIIFKIRGKYWESLLPNQHHWHFSTKYIHSLLRREEFQILETTFNNHLRQDYPFVKRLYFGILNTINSIFHTGEAMTILAKKSF
ncbi:MAG: class I SAM-dependent methyltransferase [Patescibacteria group bacterium]